MGRVARATEAREWSEQKLSCIQSFPSVFRTFAELYVLVPEVTVELADYAVPVGLNLMPVGQVIL